MASLSLPPQSQSGFPQHFDSLPPPSAQSSRRLSMPAPLPNPPFVFPAHDPDGANPDSHVETESRAPAALPAFSFNPGASQSLQPTPPPNPRAGGHRRRPSEFVGGDQLVTPGVGDAGAKPEESTGSTQPTAPPGPPSGRGPGRRHHAHRRSAAISGVDLIAINKALGTNPTAGSAPCTPGDRTFDNGHENTSRPLSYSATSLGRPTPPASPQFPPVPPIPAAIQIQPPPQNDETDIGRPSSAVSYEALAASPSTIKFDKPEIPVPEVRSMPPNRRSKPRPKTADASLAFDLVQSNNVPEVPAIKRSKSTGHSRSRKSMSTGHLDVTLENPALDDAHSTDTSRPSFSDDGSELSDTDHEGDETSPSKKSRHKSKKKQKRVRSWAGAILTRGKGKRHVKSEAEEKPKSKPRPAALTPPMLMRTNSDVGSVLEVDFDNDDVVVIRTPTNPEAPISAAERTQDVSPVPIPTLETSWKPRSFYEQNVQTQHDMLQSPIIDLDAALGPFNTPGDNRQSRGVPSKFSLATQRMYSGGRRGEFVGPEMRYHRRAESAPVMPPFDRSALSLNRLAGSSTMETPDVFYEEEEDAFLAANQTPREEGGPGPSEEAIATSSDEDVEVDSVKRVKSNNTTDTLTRAPAPVAQPKPTFHAGLGIQAKEEPASQKDTPLPTHSCPVEAMQNTHNPFHGQPRSPIEILKSEESIPKARCPPSPDVSPGFLAIDKRPATSPNELLPSIPPFSLSAGVSPSDSSFPSPDAPRSFNDRHFSSHSYHHLPSDYPYASVEDVPSLSSSASTMTNTVNRFSASFFPRARLSTDRAASFSAAVHRRSSQANASKRSSLASLSKLVGGPHSERSKLYQEEKPPGDAPERYRKKGHRLSRLMHFWKVKDKEKHCAPPTASTASIDRSV
ncbi:hypothetical protein N7462_005689 [Penicillium macrosclerotiorum]|uniref:uncharacterized protein n=1 Tax=Penicillium macrosclerotiorum TaxID=303699 RepID=UPI002547A20A|nr:uncharacterized protein N7462_005689 [Penicillium macrosclerotiorum]KAJ5682524.1 hypothetical protein N7462_005689 [Penicillium macrosclerotiorum]